MRAFIRASMVSCCVMAGGDALCQFIQHSNTTAAAPKKSDDLKIDSGSRPSQPRSVIDGFSQKFREFQWDRLRTMRWGLVGACVHGPYFLYGFRFVDRLQIWRQISNRPLLLSVAKTAFVQVTIYPVFLGVFFSAMGYLEGLSTEGIIEKTKRLVPVTFTVGCAFWPVANVINFLYVPSSARVYYVAVCGVVWNAIVSYINSKPNNKKD